MFLNKSAPHRRDYQRIIRHAEKLGCHVNYQCAGTGSVYVTVEAISSSGDYARRVYRFGSHATAHETEDFSVASGSAPKAESAQHGGFLPPGYDGFVEDAIKDLKEWVSGLSFLPDPEF